MFHDITRNTSKPTDITSMASTRLVVPAIGSSSTLEELLFFLSFLAMSLHLLFFLYNIIFYNLFLDFFYVLFCVFPF
ncbi:hypothetical protein [Methanobrevibacter sp.]|uniref:hypothetical protein n=1 Tax=Methanobrevibacter sp. TaxID=66852 RepID=UPI002B1F1AAC|nr:hypothetical protein [Methanobrevibacter sp.]